jgi:hypothetical protein
MAEPEQAERLVEVLKEIRDELRAVRIELGARESRTSTGMRTELVNRGGRWRSPALAAAATAGLTLIIGLALRDRPAPQPPTTTPTATMAVNPQVTAPAISPRAVIPTPAPVVGPAAVASRAAVPVAKPSSAAPATKQAEPSRARVPAATPTMMAAVPAPAKKRLDSASGDAAKLTAPIVSDGDGTMAFPPPPRRVRVHRLSYGPVESEPAKL